MAFKRKCKVCGKFITDENDAIEYKGGYVHSACFAITIKVLQDERTEKVTSKPRKKSAPKTESVKIPKKGMTEEEYTEKTSYYNYIKEILGGELPAKIFALTDKYMEQYKDKRGEKWTYPKMQNTLRYCKEILELELEDDCVGLLKYYYDEATSYYQYLENVQNNVKTTLDVVSSKKTEIVKINPHAKRNIKQINIEEIGVKNMDNDDCTQN